MELTSLHKFISLNKMANSDTEVVFAGQPCLKISESTHPDTVDSQAQNESYFWAILPVFAKLTYGANSYLDIPYCTANSSTLEEAVAFGLQKLWELGAFRTMVDLPEDSYAATLEEGLDSALASVNEDYKKAALKLSTSLFEASQILTKIFDGKLSIDINEATIDYLKNKLVEKSELTADEERVVLGSLIAGQTHFMSEETGLFLGSSVEFTKFVEPEITVQAVENNVEAIVEEKKSSTTFLGWKASRVQLDESRKLTATHTNGKKSAKVYKDSETGEHVVKFYTDGKHHTEADYFGSDKEDATGTAKHWINATNESLNDDDYYQVHKTSKKITKHLGKRKVGFEHKNAPEKAPELAPYCDDEHTCMTGMRAKMRGFTNEDRSEFTANEKLAGPTSTGPKKIRLKTADGRELSSHDKESDAMRAYKSLKDSRGVKFVHESEDGTEVDVTDWFIAEVKSVDDKYSEWEDNVRKAHPEKELKFKGRVEKGVHTTSAEVSGKDRSFGVWDHDKNTGHIFENEGEEIIGEEVVEIQEEVQTAPMPIIKSTFEYVSKYKAGVKAE